MNYYVGKPGWIEVICGPMFAGKTEELIRRVIRMDYAKKKYIIFKPTIDNRYSESEVVSHNKRKVNAICVTSSNEIDMASFGQPQYLINTSLISSTTFFLISSSFGYALIAIYGIITLPF